LRFDRMEPGSLGDGKGHIGDPARSTAYFGQRIVEMQIDDAVVQIEKLLVSSRH